MGLEPHKQVLVDTVEKICLLFNLSKAIKNISTSSENALLEFYDKQLSGIIKHLKHPIDQILYEPGFDLSDYNSLYNAITNFQNLHPQYRVFSSLPKIRKEIFLMLENVLSQADYNEIEPTIIYSPLYNYYEQSSLEQFQQLGILLEDGVPDRIVLMLPYADFANPLVWSILVHELSHALETKYGIVEELSESFTPHSIPTTRRSKNWASELCCDMLAIKIMGPSYLNSFINLVFSVHPWYHSASDSHPHPKLRIHFMSEYLDELGLHSNSSKYYVDFATKLYDLFTIEEEKLQLAIYIETLIEKLKEKISDIDLPDVMEPQNSVAIMNLTEKLKQETPLISSYNSTSIDHIEKEKEKYLLQKKEASEIDLNNAYSLLKLLDEKPAKPSHILNAAWEFRVDMYWDIFISIFKDPKLKYEEKFFKFAEHIDNFTFSIIKSIEVSKIHQIFRTMGK